MAVYRVKIRWSGFAGAPGYTILHFDAQTDATLAGAQSKYNQARQFCIDIASLLPTVVQLTVEAGVEIVDEASNELINILQVTPAAVVPGALTGGFASSTGACIIWETGEVKNGRRVRGRSFIVPMSGAHYDNDGTLKSTAITDITEAANTLCAGGFDFGVLSRPSAVGANDGSFHTASSGRVSDKAAVLRSRRD